MMRRDSITINVDSCNKAGFWIGEESFCCFKCNLINADEEIMIN
jgi:hypothetical protein